MKGTAESWIEQGNSCFRSGRENESLLYYYNGLKHAKALPTLIRYVNKNKENLAEDQDRLQELLVTKYHLHLAPGALSLILLSTKKQIQELEEKKHIND